MIKKMKWTSIAFALLYMAAGICLLLYPGQVSAMSCDLFGIALIIYGVINIVVYFMIDIRESLYRNDFSAGIVMILLGVLVIYHKDIFQGIVPFLLAIAVIASGFSKLQDGVDAARMGHPNGWQFLLLAVASVVFGVVLMLNIIVDENTMLQVAGAGLLYSGLTDLYTNLYLSGKIKKYLDSLDHPKEEPEPVVQHIEEPEEDTSTAAYVDWNTTADGMQAIREELSVTQAMKVIPEPPKQESLPEPVKEEEQPKPETEEKEADEPASEETDENR